MSGDLPDRFMAVHIRLQHVRSETTPIKGADGTSAQTGSRNMAVIQALDTSSKTSYSIPTPHVGQSTTVWALEN